MEERENRATIEAGNEAQGRLGDRLKEFKDYYQNRNIPRKMEMGEVVGMYSDLRAVSAGLVCELLGELRGYSDVDDRVKVVEGFVSACPFLGKGEEFDKLVAEIKRGSYSYSDLQELASSNFFEPVVRAVFRHTYALEKGGSEISLSIDRSPEGPPAWPSFGVGTSRDKLISNPGKSLEEYLKKKFGVEDLSELKFEVRWKEVNEEMESDEKLRQALMALEKIPVESEPEAQTGRSTSALADRMRQAQRAREPAPA